MKIPGLGEFTLDEGTDWYISEPVRVPLLRDAECEIALEEYDDDSHKEEFHAAIQNFLSAPFAVLKEVEGDIFAYYQDMNACWQPSDEEYLVIESPSGVWDHIEFGFEPVVSRGDDGVYVSLECSCDWEPEHGLQIVFKNGNKVSKVGPYDGHLTNANAFADDSLKDVIYRRMQA